MGPGRIWVERARQQSLPLAFLGACGLNGSCALMVSKHKADKRVLPANTACTLILCCGKIGMSGVTILITFKCTVQGQLVHPRCHGAVTTIHLSVLCAVHIAASPFSFN